MIAEPPILLPAGEPPKPPRLPVAGRLALYLLSVLVLGVLADSLPTELHGVSLGGSPFPWLMLVQEASLFAAVFLPAWLLAQVEHRAAGEYGLPWRRPFGWRFWQGCVLGLAEVSVLICSISVFGGYAFGGVVVRGPAIFEWLLFWFVFFVLVGFCEEFAFRGYVQFTLAQSIGFWPAAWILSLTFGGLHLLNRGESWVGAASVAVTGLVFAFTLRRTGNLWLAVGWHAAFDFGETFLFSVPNSGLVFAGHLSNAVLRGPIWLTGGTVGPEGSVFSFLLMGLAALLIHFLFPLQAASPAPADTIASAASQ